MKPLNAREKLDTLNHKTSCQCIEYASVLCIVMLFAVEKENASWTGTVHYCVPVRQNIKIGFLNCLQQILSPTSWIETVA
jgi:hypothetical protein